ncbi:hypothetical protein PF005_g3491 [Phytophthora fragariae]|uniref:Uncharacterized protein n=2 Tax=Phytophthora fragariae TaxID=53985 RepID=A0A6A3FKY1_9STRA|nr:hypothetical protein PF003_g11060 [Phytophthora fragariae]KAE8946535.1 hypothetical protein PF009_g3836 [Phytophthora fragariae]KAE9025716.1 hypothetical protein PF011_g2906 [Phytophthora fragariae]KAE9133362.1 hypothetical protein PF007_g3386 [Phytophthora fragariae]KAE9152756.1 hypothetical protein PF006_g3045 [Phytophthora fragariae]
MIPPFYSDSSTMEKARSFWNPLGRATVDLDETLRLNAFRGRLRGNSGEEWWLHSKISDLETLQIRCHSQFVCLTPQRSMDRLSTMKRTRGMSAEVWGDWISGICDDAQCFDPLTRYQYFLDGLRNSEWKTMPSTTMVNSIQQAVTILLYQNTHLPVEDDADFADIIASEIPTEDMVTMQMLQQNQNMIIQQQKVTWGLHYHEGTAFASAAYERHTPQDQQNASISAPTSVPPTDHYVSRCSSTAFQEMAT